MSSRSLNRVQLIGNLTRDPELRYTPQGTAVCTFGLATNRSWTTDQGEKKEETEFHRVVSWNKLAELCAQYLFKGRRTYVEGRLQTRQWNSPEGDRRQATEIVIDEMIILDSRRGTEGETASKPVTSENQVVEEIPNVPEPTEVSPSSPTAVTSNAQAVSTQKKTTTKKTKKTDEEKEEANDQDSSELKAEDIPF